MSETENASVPSETLSKLAHIADKLGSLNTGSSGDTFWLATNDDTGGYDWSQLDIGVTKSGQLVVCYQSGCSCNGPEEPTPDESFPLDGEVTISQGWNSEAKEAVAELVAVTDTLYKVLTNDDVTAEEIIGIPNAEVRRAVVELVGYEKVVDQAEVLDESDKDGKLLRVPLENDEDMVLLFVQDPSTDRRYFLRVPPNMKTARQARAWTFGFDAKDFEPLVET